MRKAAEQARIFDEYAHSDDPEVAERAKNWQMGIGLQAVDNLAVSDFLLETARKHIVGEISMEEVKRLIKEYHAERERRGASDEEN